MSNSPDSGLDLEDLELQLLPSWAKQSAGANQYSGFEGASDVRPERQRDRRRPPGRSFDRPPGGRPPGPASRRRDDRDRGRPSPGPGSSRGGQPGWEPKPPVPLPELGVALIPEAKGVESLARQIRLTGRAYPVFEIAQLILRKPERYEVCLEKLKQGDRVPQQLWLCNIDDTPWLSEADAVQHVLQRHFGTFYQSEKTPTAPPKGTYTFVAQCGLSGTILGPPNFHDYQAKLLRLHASRFSRMPFEAYKSKVRIVRDEAIVKKWVEDQSYKTEFVALNIPEPVRLASLEEVEKHFREVHLANIIVPVDSWRALGPVAQNLAALPLRQLVRRTWEDQRRFPLKLVGVLSQQLASHGLQFFKVNRTVTHVAVARPHYLDLELTPVSDGIRRIVDFINGHAGCTRRQMTEALAPAPPAVLIPIAPVEAGPIDQAAATQTAPAEPPTVDGPPRLTPEQTAITADLHWLIHQGHVIEFANGRLETAKKPKPKPVRSERPNPDRAQGQSAEAGTPEGGEGNAESDAPDEGAVIATEGDVESAPGTPPAGEVFPKIDPASNTPGTAAAQNPAPAEAISDGLEGPAEAEGKPQSAEATLPEVADDARAVTDDPPTPTAAPADEPKA